MNIIKLALAAAVLSVSACANVPPPQPADPATQARIQGEITNACLADGVFKLVGGRMVLSTAISAIPVAGPAGSAAYNAIITAGVDQVCANPTAFANTVAGAEATAAWVISNIRGALAGH